MMEGRTGWMDVRVDYSNDTILNLMMKEKYQEKEFIIENE